MEERKIRKNRRNKDKEGTEKEDKCVCKIIRK